MDTQSTAQGSVAMLLPIMGLVFIAFLVIGLAMPVLPLHVHQGLGLGTFVVGLVAGSQFATSLVSRVWAGGDLVKFPENHSEGVLYATVHRGNVKEEIFRSRAAIDAVNVAFTTCESKREDALDVGADEVVVSRNAQEMEKHAGSFDFILNTVAASHDLDADTQLVKRDGTLCLLGVPEHPHPTPDVSALIFKRRAIAGSLMGGIAETQEMLNFCAEHDVVSDIEMIPA